MEPAPVNLNTRLAIVSNVFMCTLPALVIILLPVLVTGVIESLNVSEQKAGFFVSVDMTGYTLGTICCSFYIDRFRWNTIARISLILLIIFNILSSLMDNYNLLLLFRLLSGAGGGILTAVTFATISQMRDPDSVYGYWLALQAVMGGIGFFLFPTILGGWGVGGAFALLAVLCMIALPMVRYIPEGCLRPEKKSFDKHLLLPVALGIVGIFFFECGLMSPFAYIDRLGVAAGFSMEQTSLSLSASTVGGLIGGLAAAALSARFGRVLPIVIGNTILMLALFTLRMGSSNYLAYTVGVVAIFGVWSFVLPYMVGVIASWDKSGQALSLANAALGIALMAGPFLGALIIGESIGQHSISAYYPLIFTGIAMLIASCVCIIGATKSLKN